MAPGRHARCVGPASTGSDKVNGRSRCTAHCNERHRSEGPGGQSQGSPRGRTPQPGIGQDAEEKADLPRAAASRVQRDRGSTATVTARAQIGHPTAREARRPSAARRAPPRVLTRVHCDATTAMARAARDRELGVNGRAKPRLKAASDKASQTDEVARKASARSSDQGHPPTPIGEGAASTSELRGRSWSTSAATGSKTPSLGTDEATQRGQRGPDPRHHHTRDADTRGRGTTRGNAPSEGRTPRRETQAARPGRTRSKTASASQPVNHCRKGHRSSKQPEASGRARDRMGGVVIADARRQATKISRDRSANGRRSRTRGTRGAAASRAPAAQATRSRVQDRVASFARAEGAAARWEKPTRRR